MCKPEGVADDVDLESVRRAYRQEGSYLKSVSRRTRKILEATIDHPRFAGATDPAALELIGAFLSTMRPQRVLQLGTYIGFSAVFIADVIAHGDPPGQLVTVEPDESANDIARGLARKAELENITFVSGYSTEERTIAELKRLGPFDFVYLDSSHAYGETLRELDIIFDSRQPLLSREGLLVLHDAAESAAEFDPTGKGGVRRALEEWSSGRGERFVVLEQPLFPSICGVGLMVHGSTAQPTEAGA